MESDIDTEPTTSCGSAENAIRALQAADVGTWRFDPISRTISLSAIAARRLGTCVDVQPLTALLERLHADDRVIAERAFGDAPIDIDVRPLASGGAEAWLRLRGRVIEEADGGSAIHGVLADITSRKAR